MDAYAEEGIRTFQTCKKVKFFRAVSYCVRDRVFEDGEDIEDYTANKGITQLRIHVGDIIEFRADWEPDERGFARVFGIMLHERNVFLVVGWIIAAGRKNPTFMLPEYKQLTPFENNMSGFFSLSLVDEPRFVNGVHFEEIGGKLLRNDWVFRAV